MADYDKYQNALLMMTDFVKDDLMDQLLANLEVMKDLRAKFLLSNDPDLATLEAVDREIALTSKVLLSIPQQLGAINQVLLNG